VEQRGKYGDAGSPASQATDNFRPDDNHRSEGTQGGNSGKSGQTHINSRSVEALRRRKLRGKNIKAPAYTHLSREAARGWSRSRAFPMRQRHGARRQDRIVYASLIAVIVVLLILFIRSPSAFALFLLHRSF
jgi:hypothetical protein